MAHTTEGASARLFAPGQTAAIVLGAQGWPRAPQLHGGPAFARSAADIEAYLRDPGAGLRLAQRDLLSLFDSPLPGPAQVDEVGAFLRRREQEGVAGGQGGLRDVFVYYVGHGAFPEASNQLFLLVQSGDPEHWDTSCVLVSSLARRIRMTVPFARQVVVLDCCFSGAAVRDWQAGAGAQGVMLRASVEDAAPTSGAVLLCSSASEMVSMAPMGAPHTMFTGALLAALRGGNPALGPTLSARDVRDLAWIAMRARWEHAAVRPVVVPVDRGHGDLSEHGAFPNPAAERHGDAGTTPGKAAGGPPAGDRAGTPPADEPVLQATPPTRQPPDLETGSVPPARGWEDERPARTDVLATLRAIRGRPAWQPAGERSFWLRELPYYVGLVGLPVVVWLAIRDSDLVRLLLNSLQAPPPTF